MRNPDPRLHAYRPDLADADLKGRVDAPRFVEGQAYQVCATVLPLRKAPDIALGYESELLFGEAVQVFDERDGWSWVQSLWDGYVGYCRSDGLLPGAITSTHRVKVPRSHIYTAPSIKSAPIRALPLGAALAASHGDGRFLQVGGPVSGYAIADHLVNTDQWAGDPVAVAESLLGVPYLWGGKSSQGLDCSALVQSACRACGISAPRDSDMQEAALGSALERPDDLSALPRGALLFWPGHVAISQGGGLMIHANAYHMQVVSEPIGPALARIAAAGSLMRSLRLLPGIPG